MQAAVLSDLNGTALWALFPARSRDAVDKMRRSIAGIKTPADLAARMARAINRVTPQEAETRMVSVEAIADRDRRADIRAALPPHAVLLGDPLPGYSALDRKMRSSGVN